MANPFELKGRKEGPEKEPKAATWTPEEQMQKLKGYIEVPPEYWENIRTGTHVRYISKTNGFRSGGFVAQNPLDIKSKETNVEKRYIKIRNGFNEKAANYLQWVVPYEDLEKIYIKADATVLVVMHTIQLATKGLNENIRKIAEYAKKLEARIAALEKR